VLRAGDASCPAPPYINKRLVHTSTNDTRGCASCTCSVPPKSCAGGLVYTGPLATCPASGSTTAYGTCFSQGSFLGSNWKITANAPEMTCDVAGGQPTGDLVPLDPVTLCCQ
jgi:hypothetical protein